MYLVSWIRKIIYVLYFFIFACRFPYYLRWSWWIGVMWDRFRKKKDDNRKEHNVRGWCTFSFLRPAGARLPGVCLPCSVIAERKCTMKKKIQSLIKEGYLNALAFLWLHNFKYIGEHIFLETGSIFLFLIRAVLRGEELYLSTTWARNLLISDVKIKIIGL
jgi:hypothetical protein